MQVGGTRTTTELKLEFEYDLNRHLKCLLCVYPLLFLYMLHCGPITALDLFCSILFYSTPFYCHFEARHVVWWPLLGLLSWYTLGKKYCYTPIEDNKINVDRTFVFPLGWNWHDMDPWLFPNEIRHYLGQTFNARSSGIVQLRNHSIGGHSPKSIFTLWQPWINIWIFFQKFFLIVRTMPRPTPMGIRHEVFALAREGIKQGAIAARVGLTRATVNRILKRHAATGSLVPRKSSGAPRKTTPRQDRALLRMVRQDRFLSARPWRRGWEICTEWGLVAQRLTTDSCPVVTGHIDPQRSPCWLPTTVVSAWSGRRGGGTWQWPTVTP